MKKRVTIQDIADALGISRNTVSKAINNSDGLADATRERILAKAVEMGYKQFSYVQALTEAGQELRLAEEAAPGSMGEIALLTAFHFSGSHFAVTMLDRLKRELAQFGYTIGFYYVSQEDLQQRQLPYPLPHPQTRAYICFEMFNWDYDEMLCGQNLPVLFVDGPSKRLGRPLPADQLYMENGAELSKLIRKMLRQGKQRFGFVGDIDHCQSFFERYLALRYTMLLADQPVNKDFLILQSHPIEVFHALLQLKELPDLFLCANDYIAMDVINALKKMGKSVPEDVLVCGFDDSAESRALNPSLTTVHIHTQSMAIIAAYLLITRIKEPALDYRTVYVQTELVERETTKLLEGDAE